jgi:hypothetical protein
MLIAINAVGWEEGWEEGCEVGCEVGLEGGLDIACFGFDLRQNTFPKISGLLGT